MDNRPNLSQSPSPEVRIVGGDLRRSWINRINSVTDIEQRDVKLFYGPQLPMLIQADMMALRELHGLVKPSLEEGEVFVDIGDDIKALIAEHPGLVVDDTAKGWKLERTIQGQVTADDILRDASTIEYHGHVKSRHTKKALYDLRQALVHHKASLRLLKEFFRSNPKVHDTLVDTADVLWGENNKGLTSGYAADWPQIACLYHLAHTMPRKDFIPLLQEWAEYYSVMSFKVPNKGNYTVAAAYTAKEYGLENPWQTVKFLNPKTSGKPEEAQKRRELIKRLFEDSQYDVSVLYKENARVAARITILEHLSTARTEEEVMQKLAEVAIMTALQISPYNSVLIRQIKDTYAPDFIAVLPFIAFPEIAKLPSTDELRTQVTGIRADDSEED